MARLGGLILCIFLSNLSFAKVAITKERKTLVGLQQVGIVKSEKGWNVTMNSNYFLRDTSRAGLFELKNLTSVKKDLLELSNIYKKIKKIEKKIDRVKNEKRITLFEYYYNVGGVKIRSREW